jgi:hypothetical protein
MEIGTESDVRLTIIIWRQTLFEATITFISTSDNRDENHAIPVTFMTMPITEITKAFAVSGDLPCRLQTCD